jgi:hypothetical protein
MLLLAHGFFGKIGVLVVIIVVGDLVLIEIFVALG